MDKWAGLSEAQEAELWRALMSVMMMGVSLRNEHGFFILNPCSGREETDYRVETPEKFLNVCRQIANPQWVCGDDIEA